MKNCKGCPMNFSDYSEKIQNYGCLPEPYELIKMRTNHGKTWACHSDNTKPCVGTIKELKNRGLEYKVIDSNLITERDQWDLYIK